MNEPTRPRRESEGMPRWLVLLLIGLLVVLLLIVAIRLVGGGHQPMKHGSGAPEPVAQLREV